MVATRSPSRLSEEPTSISPKKPALKKAGSSPTKSKAGRKRKTQELASKSTKDKAENPTKHVKKAHVEDDLKQTTVDSGLKREPREEKEEGKEEGIGQGAEETGNRSLSDEEQLQQESKCAISVSSTRQKKVESSPTMEKGLIYFFFRPKVAVEHAESIDDVQRSYIVLRPLPLGTRLRDGVVGGGEGSFGLIAVPKKRLPGRGYEKFLTFVEEPKISTADLESRFLKGSTYMTKTRGERTNSPMEPIGEGIYALTKPRKSAQLTWPTFSHYLPHLMNSRRTLACSRGVIYC